MVTQSSQRIQIHSGGGARIQVSLAAKPMLLCGVRGRKGVGNGEECGWESFPGGENEKRSGLGKEVLLEDGPAQQGLELLNSTVLGVSER